LARNGDRNAALQVYRELVEFLNDDPKASPEEETTILYRRLRAEARQSIGTHAAVAAPMAAVPLVQGYLPHPLTDMVGKNGRSMPADTKLLHAALGCVRVLSQIGQKREEGIRLADE